MDFIHWLKKFLLLFLFFDGDNGDGFYKVLGIVSVLSFKILWPPYTNTFTYNNNICREHMCAQNQPKTQNNEPN